MLRRIITLLINLSYRSLFLTPENFMNKAKTSLKTLFLALSFVYILIEEKYYPVILLPYLVLYIYKENRLLQFLSILTLSLVPAIWMALTSYITNYLMGELFSYQYYISVTLRTLLFSMIIITYIASLRPGDLAFFLYKTGNNKLYPYITWRLIPLILKDTVIAIQAQHLKGEKTWKALQVSIANQLERKDKITAINYSLITLDPFIEQKTLRKSDNFYLILNTVLTILIAIHYIPKIQ